MRRFRDRQSSGLFRGGEMTRMATMIGMLLVLVMLIRKAGDPDTWRFLAGDPSPVAAASDAPVPGNNAVPTKSVPPADASASTAEGAAAADGDQPRAAEAPAEEMPPLDEDADEQEAIAAEFQAITDRAPIAKEDMFAYWRLLRWAESAKLPEMLRRARTDVRYGDLILDPAAHRGELIKTRLHVVQLLKFAAAPDNPLGIETYYQAVGWNDDSQAWFYFCIFTDLPPGMPIGERIMQEGTFVGYFLKTTTYKDGAGKETQAPVLIGRMVWHPNPQAKPREDDGLMTWLIVGVLVVGFGLRTIWRMKAGKKREPLTGLLGSHGGNGDEPSESVEDWLDRAESRPADEAINPAGQHESNGNGADHSRSFPRDERLDRSDER